MTDCLRGGALALLATMLLGAQTSFAQPTASPALQEAVAAVERFDQVARKLFHYRPGTSDIDQLRAFRSLLEADTLQTSNLETTIRRASVTYPDMAQLRAGTSEFLQPNATNYAASPEKPIQFAQTALLDAALALERLRVELMAIPENQRPERTLANLVGRLGLLATEAPRWLAEMAMPLRSRVMIAGNSAWSSPPVVGIRREMELKGLRVAAEIELQGVRAHLASLKADKIQAADQFPVVQQGELAVAQAEARLAEINESLRYVEGFTAEQFLNRLASLDAKGLAEVARIVGLDPSRLPSQGNLRLRSVGRALRAQLQSLSPETLAQLRTVVASQDAKGNTSFPDLRIQLNKLSERELRVWAGENMLEQGAKGKSALVEQLLPQASELARKEPYRWADANQTLRELAQGKLLKLEGSIEGVSRHSLTLNRTPGKYTGMIQLANSLGLPPSFLSALRGRDGVKLSAVETQTEGGKEEYRLVELSSPRLSRGRAQGTDILSGSLLDLMKGRPAGTTFRYEALMPEEGSRALAARVRVALPTGVWSSQIYRPAGTLGWVEELEKGKLHFTPDGERFGFELPASKLDPRMEALRKGNSKDERERRRILNALAENGRVLTSATGRTLSRAMEIHETESLEELRTTASLVEKISAHRASSAGITEGLSGIAEEKGREALEKARLELKARAKKGR